MIKKRETTWGISLYGHDPCRRNAHQRRYVTRARF